MAELLHEVSLRSSSNRMDAFNLAVVISPNLLKSRNPAIDINMCMIPGGSPQRSASSRPFQVEEDKTTLGQIIQLCIQRYYEVFDDIPDRSEAAGPPSQEGVIDHSPSRSHFPPSPSSQSLHSYKRDSMIDDDEDIDDAMLVMPLGPNAGGSRAQGAAAPSSSWGAGQGSSTLR